MALAKGFISNCTRLKNRKPGSIFSPSTKTLKIHPCDQGNQSVIMPGKQPNNKMPEGPKELAGGEKKAPGFYK